MCFSEECLASPKKNWIGEKRPIRAEGRKKRDDRDVEASDQSATIPDFLSLIPEGYAKQVVLYCVNSLALSIEDTHLVLYDASNLAQAINYLLAGGTYRVRHS